MGPIYGEGVTFNETSVVAIKPASMTSVDWPEPDSEFLKNGVLFVLSSTVIQDTEIWKEFLQMRVE